MDASQGEKIIRFQNLYKTYSSLLFTNPTDRPIAVSGIQRRLLEAFGTRGGYGVFDEDVKTGQLGLLRRSLLWHRAVDGEGNSRLSRIEFSTAELTDSTAPVVPSWSWMAYTGEISFLKLDFGAIDWIKIRSPWGAEDGQATARFADGRRNLALKAPARIINVTLADAWGVGKLYFDDFARTEGKEIPCVVLGTDKQKTAADEKVHYFILIELAAPSGLGLIVGPRMYKLHFFFHLFFNDALVLPYVDSSCLIQPRFCVRRRRDLTHPFKPFIAAVNRVTPNNTAKPATDS
ncbi:hypothetical protein F4859DRAFT_509597 [Xylaria cf. heliscus]|nr:hypothetical protein F4859DRAFT_509597 [Xylaria cf. heliscus]